MTRVKRGVAAHKKHKKLLGEAVGRRGAKRKLVRPAREATSTSRPRASVATPGRASWPRAT